MGGKEPSEDEEFFPHLIVMHVYVMIHTRLAI
jgi:hypothetical protein